MSWAADKMIASENFSLGMVRKIFTAIAHLGSAAALIGLAFTGCNQILSVLWLCIAVGLAAGIYSGFAVGLKGIRTLLKCKL